MKQVFYRIIYQSTVNQVLRRINKLLLPVLPCKIKLPPSGFIYLRDSGGQRIKLYTNQTNYLTHLVYWEGGALNFEYTDIFLELIKKVNSFYDIGANIGYYSLLAAAGNKHAKIVGFEPAGGPLHFFRKNVTANRFNQIRIEPIALAEKEGELTFFEIKNKKYTYLRHNLAGESNAGSKTSGKNFVQVKVRASTLDKYVKAHHDSVDLIKMDTEGTEHLILGAASNVIETFKPVIICETLFNTIENELESIMKSHGYQFYNHVSGGLKKVETIRRETDDGVRNCFFVHPSRVDLIKSFII